MADELTLEIYRGDNDAGEMVTYSVPRAPGMVVLDGVHAVQARHAPDLAVRWNCKAGKCGSCSAEVNGRPRLMCMDRVDGYPAGATIAIRPIKTFPVIRDLATDVSSNYRHNRRIPGFRPPDGKVELEYTQDEADRVQEFRKCIECFLCQNVCHVLRDHQKHEAFAGPRYFVRAAGLEMHPEDTRDRVTFIKDRMAIGYCNITKCCTHVCPESIKITDNAIIPLKERVVDAHYDPVLALWRRVVGRKKGSGLRDEG